MASNLKSPGVSTRKACFFLIASQVIAASGSTWCNSLLGSTPCCCKVFHGRIRCGIWPGCTRPRLFKAPKLFVCFFHSAQRDEQPAAGRAYRRFLKITFMAKGKYVPKVDKRLLTVKISYNENSNHFFVDFWDIDDKTQEAKYLVSININRNEAEGISRDTGIKILNQ